LAESGKQHALIKLAPKLPGTKRELLFAEELHGAANVLPIIGTGQTENHWAMLMPKAEKSLRDHLDESSGVLSEDEVRRVLVDLAETLVTLAEIRVIHRDVKPENILLFEGKWCLADFGISRYADASTGTHTWKSFKTKFYAAPEQWRREASTSATDVYAFGVTGYELLAGTRPFQGTGDELEQQHLHAQPPPITAAASLGALIQECLFKAPESRPTAQDVLDRLRRPAAQGPTGYGLAFLQDANLVATRNLAQQAIDRIAAQSESERREELLHAAHHEFGRLNDELKQAILSSAPSAEQLPPRTYFEPPGWQLTLDKACLGLSRVFAELDELLSSKEPKYPFDVIAWAYIAVADTTNQRRPIGKAHSLWYCNASEQEIYSWHETAFADESIDISRRKQRIYLFGEWSNSGIYTPHAISPWSGDDRFASNLVESENKLAWPFTSLNADTLDNFIDRWAGWFAACSQGLL
jgi:eukaryotic-like serine/threonine-protein kinase